MSANKENEETLRQMESRLQQLESQRRREEYEREENERTERKARAYVTIWAAIAFTITLILSIISSAPPPTPFILGIITVVLWILGLGLLSRANE